MATLHVQVDFNVSRSPLVPFNATICPMNNPKRRQKAPKSAQCAPTPRIQERAVSWVTWLNTKFRGHLVHLQPPTFCGFQASQSRFILNISQKLTSTENESIINLEKSIHKLIPFCLYLLQLVEGCKMIYWGTKWVLDELVVGATNPS